MLLKEKLKKCRINVKIGTVNGGGWFFVGIPNDMIKMAHGYDEFIAQKLSENLERAKAQKARLGNPRTEKEKEKYKKVTEAIEWHEAYIRDHLPLLDRHVRQMYMSDPLVDDSLCILIDGNETGGYWMVSEAKDPVSFKGFSQRIKYGEV